MWECGARFSSILSCAVFRPGRVITTAMVSLPASSSTTARVCQCGAHTARLINMHNGVGARMKHTACVCIARLQETSLDVQAAALDLLDRRDAPFTQDACNGCLTPTIHHMMNSQGAILQGPEGSRMLACLLSRSCRRCPCVCGEHRFVPLDSFLLRYL